MADELVKGAHLVVADMLKQGQPLLRLLVGTLGHILEVEVELGYLQVGDF